MHYVSKDLWIIIVLINMLLIYSAHINCYDASYAAVVVCFFCIWVIYNRPTYLISSLVGNKFITFEYAKLSSMGALLWLCVTTKAKILESRHWLTEFPFRYHNCLYVNTDMDFILRNIKLWVCLFAKKYFVP